MGKMKRLTGWDYIAGVKVGDTLVGVKDQQAFHRLALIEDILGDEYDLDWLRKLILANSLIGKEVWGSEIVFRIFGYHEENIERATIQYISILKDRTILCHTKTCAIPIEEFNKTIFLTKDEAVRNVKQNPGKN